MQTPHTVYIRPRALVVDDSVTLQRQMGLTLHPLGIDIEYTDRGDNAITMALKNSYHVIFLDVMLPGANGYQVCKAVKRDPQTKHVPVIMLTSKDSTFDKVKGVMAGTDLYLTKPVTSADLMAAIEQHAPGLLAAGAWWLKMQAVKHQRSGHSTAPLAHRSKT